MSYYYEVITIYIKSNSDEYDILEKYKKFYIKGFVNYNILLYQSIILNIENASTRL